MENENIYILISKYFDNECTQDELLFILDWCNQSEENKTEFIQLKKAWTIADKESNEIISSLAPKIWHNISTSISEKFPKAYTRRALIYYTSTSAAVALLLMFCINLFMNENLRNYQSEYTSFYMPRGEKGQLFLPDGTKVWLNADSKITLGNGFNTKSRTVMLEGEAFFDVAKNDRYKFIVQTSSVDIKVHGTAFNVTAYPESEDVNVSLQRGSVGIYKKDSDEKLAALVPNQHISVNKKTFLTKVDSFNDDTAIAWTFEELIFEHTPLKEVFAKMGNWYGVNISVVSSPSGQDLKYRFKIKSESLTEILELINKMTPIEYEINGKEVHVKYKPMP